MLETDRPIRREGRMLDYNLEHDFVVKARYAHVFSDAPPEF
jgi:hypothetical protein